MKSGILIVLLLFLAGLLFAGNIKTIDDLIGIEIYISDVWAGQSITLMKESDEYFIVRKYFGSGIPVIMETKYRCEVKSKYQVVFSKDFYDDDTGRNVLLEEFTLTIDGYNNVRLYLNGLELVIKIIEQLSVIHFPPVFLT